MMVDDSVMKITRRCEDVMSSQCGAAPHARDVVGIVNAVLTAKQSSRIADLAKVLV